MRKLKFRAFDDDKKQMIYNFKKTHYQLLWDEDNEEFFCGGLQSNGDWNQPYLMQFTGLKDKKGKDVYEGDIIKINASETIVSIEWSKSDFAFVLWHENMGWVILSFLKGLKDFEIIGNIYENPELMNPDK